MKPNKSKSKSLYAKIKVLIPCPSMNSQMKKNSLILKSPKKTPKTSETPRKTCFLNPKPNQPKVNWAIGVE
jgi:hypothetical protein